MLEKSCDAYWIQLSSAKSQQNCNILFETLLTYIKKSKGPNTEPCGTPDFIQLLDDKTSLYITF